MFKGYWPATTPDFDVDSYNHDMNVTNAQRMAMEIGSIFGFDLPDADPDHHITTRTTRTTTTKRKMTKKQMRKKAKAILDNPYYQTLRDYGQPAKEALRAVRWFEAFRAGSEATYNKDKRSYPSGIARVVRGYWVFGH